MSPASHRVVAEVRVGDVAVLVAQQAPAADQAGIEGHLGLHLTAHGLEGAGEVLPEHPLGVLQLVDVVVGAVSLVGELLHEHVVVVAHAEAHGGQGDALVSSMTDRGEDAVRPGAPEVGHAVTAEDQAGRGARTLEAAGHLVGQPQSGLGVGRVLDLQAVDGRQDHLALLGAGGLEGHAGLAAVDHQGHAVAFLQLAHQHLQRSFHQAEAVFSAHAARHVDHEHQVGGAPVDRGHLAGGHADAHQVVPPAPKALGMPSTCRAKSSEPW